MEGVDEDGERLSISLGPSRDLLKRFMNQPQFSSANEQNNEGVNVEELELSLGLSLNGRFGVDPSRKKLKRSSSISNLGFTVGGGVDHGSARGGYPPLFRTSSLPTKGKDLLTMKQMEARQKRMKKLKNVRLVKDKEIENCVGVGVECVDGFENGNGNGNGNGNRNVWPSSQGSMGSQGSGSSGFDDLQSQQMEVARQTTEVQIPANHQALPAQVEQRPITRAADGDVHVANQLIKMPYVSLRGGAGNGNRTEGLLYRYNKGDDIKIVCVCHGLFLSPAEFVKHGGGGDVEFPLKHIVVNPSPLF